MWLVGIFSLISVSNAQRGSFRIGVGPQLGVLSEEIGYGGVLNIDLDINGKQKSYLGMEVGVVQWTKSNSYGSSLLAALSFMPSFVYVMEQPNSDILPYGGFLVGGAIGREIVDAEMSFLGEDISISRNERYYWLNGFIRTGILTRVNDRVSGFVESRFGVLDEQFVAHVATGLLLNL